MPVLEDPRTTDRTWGDRVDRVVPALFATFLAVGFVVLVAVGRDGWFNTGDLVILIEPFDDVFAPVEQHWTTIPILIYKAIFAVAGFEFWPFLVLVVLSHLAIAALVYAVARRAGVRAWVAALVASLLVLFAPGYLSMVMPIQITQNLSIICGFSQLLLADHEGSDRRRDALALGVGVIGLMSSGVMPALVLATGLALLVRRGWRSAALQTVPLGALFIGWYLWKQAYRSPAFLPYQAPYDLGTHVRTVVRGLVSAYETMGSGAPGAALLALTLVVGLVVRFAGERPRQVVRDVAAPLALAFSSVVYLAIVAFQRSSGTPDYIEWSHHAYNTMAMSLPAVAVAVAALVDRWKVLAPVVVATSVVLGAANVRFDEADRQLSHRTEFLRFGKQALIEAANDPQLDARADATPDKAAGPVQVFAGHLTYERLRRFRDEGKIPDP